MTRHPVHPTPDPARDHPLWRALVETAHVAAALPTQGSLDRLAEGGLKARDLWTLPAPYPRGLCAKAFAGLAFAYGRQTDAGERAKLSPLMLAAAGLVEELLSAPEATPAPVTDEQAAPRVRLPYRED